MTSAKVSLVCLYCSARAALSSSVLSDTPQPLHFFMTFNDHNGCIWMVLEVIMVFKLKIEFHSIFFFHPYGLSILGVIRSQSKQPTKQHFICTMSLISYTVTNCF